MVEGALAPGFRKLPQTILSNMHPIALKPQGDGVYCYHFDATGKTVALTDQNQNIASTYAYQPFGEQTQGQTQTINAGLIGQSSLLGSVGCGIAGGFVGAVTGGVVGAALPDLIGYPAAMAAGSAVGGFVGGAAGGAASSLYDNGHVSGQDVLVGAFTGGISGMIAAPGVGLVAALDGADMALGLVGAAGGIMGDTLVATERAIRQKKSTGK